MPKGRRVDDIANRRPAAGNDISDMVSYSKYVHSCRTMMKAEDTGMGSVDAVPSGSSWRELGSSLNALGLSRCDATT